MSSWVPVPEGSLFPLAALPYGVATLPGAARGDHRAVAAIGDLVVDLAALAEHLAPGQPGLLRAPTLDPFLAAGPATWSQVRSRLTGLLTDEADRAVAAAHLHPAAGVTLHLPFTVADYVDFYASEHHATNLGRMFRPDQEPLTPNWRHLPIGYHGRSGTVAVSGTPVRRPCGQRKAPDEPAPTFGPSRRLDVEAEVGFVVGTPSELGAPVPVSSFADHVFGVCLVNDWSARDLQAWEYVPLGPFLGKSFLTSVSPWLMPLEALGAARVAPQPRPVPVLDYLRDGDEPWGLDLQLEVRLNGEVVSRPPFAGMYWTAAQQLAHMTVNGASLRTGDLFASGTVSGPAADQRGSLIELSWNGTAPLALADGSTRTFLADGDEVVISATAPGPGGARIGLGEVRGRIEPAPC